MAVTYQHHLQPKQTGTRRLKNPEAQWMPALKSNHHGFWAEREAAGGLVVGGPKQTDPKGKVCVMTGWAFFYHLFNDMPAPSLLVSHAAGNHSQTIEHSPSTRGWDNLKGRTSMVVTKSALRQ